MTFIAFVLGIAWLKSDTYSQMIHDDSFPNHQQPQNSLENIPLYKNLIAEA
jgi:hypothetical protein